MLNIKRSFTVALLLLCFFSVENHFAQKYNQFNENGKRTGLWKKYHPNKRIRYTGQFKNGKEVGVFKFYSINSSKYPIAIKTYFDGTDSLFVQFFDVEGRIETEGIFHGRKREGNWKYFYPDGTLLSEENYKNGELHGDQIVYYPDGLVTEFATYNNGMLEGVCSKYSNKGVLIEEITYKNGKPNGIAKFYELNGNLKETGEYKDGKRFGKWEYYIDGEVATDKKKKENRSSFKSEN